MRLDRGLVETALRSAPASFVLTPRNAANRVILGANHLNFGLVAGPPNVHDCERGRRSGNYRDYCDFIRLAQYFNAMHLIGNQVCAPIELPANTRHLDTYRANLEYSDKVYHCTAIGAGRALDGIRMMAISRGLSLSQIAESPGVITIISVNSPRRFDEAMCDGLIAMAEHGQAVVITPFTLMGAMAPASLAAALAQQNAEALFGIVLAQLVRPGTPVVYGAFTSNVDMRSGAPAFGTPENAKANIASGQLARRYRLPYRTSNASASNAADAQGAYETEMSLWGAVLGHGNLVYHAAGWQEGGLTASFEKLILDVEMLQLMIEFLKPIVVDEPRTRVRRDQRGRDRRAFLRRAAHHGAVRARVLPAAGIELAELRELADRRRQGRDAARDRAVEAGAQRIPGALVGSRDSRSARCVCRGAAHRNRRRRPLSGGRAQSGRPLSRR